MVEISRLLFHRFPSCSADADAANDAQVRLFPEIESYDSDVEDVYEIVENDFRLGDFEFDRAYNLINGNQATGATNLETLEKLQETLNQISLSLGQFMTDRLGFMERNIFRLNNGEPPIMPNLQNAPLDVRMVAFLLAQGDNRNVEELLRTVHQNIVVNVNMSYYFKIMLVMLTFNTLLLFKWILWDQWPLFQ